MDFEVGDYVIVRDDTTNSTAVGSVGVVCEADASGDGSTIRAVWVISPDVASSFHDGGAYTIEKRWVRKITEDEYNAQAVRLKMLKAAGVK